MSRSELHNWECEIESLCGDNADKILAIAQDIYNTAYVRGKNYMSLEKELTLNEIRAEIEQLTSRYTLSRERGGMGQVEWSDRLIKESDILQIVDKYKAESKVEVCF